jgi:predicted cupin superfamily sugar epimerase
MMGFKAFHNDADKIIKLYNLKVLQFEGGYFKQKYKIENNSSNKIPSATAIIFLLKLGDKSKLHKLSGDEVYHFYTGDPIRMLLLSPDVHQK